MTIRDFIGVLAAFMAGFLVGMLAFGPRYNERACRAELRLAKTAQDSIAVYRADSYCFQVSSRP